MQLLAALAEIASEAEQPIIAIDGPAGAGKTTLAQNISLALSPQLSTTVIHMDELYPGWEQALGTTLTETLHWLVQSHKAMKPLKYSPFNWATNEFSDSRTLDSTELLILEGVGSAQRIIEDSLTTSIWLDLDPLIGFQRVIERDGASITAQMKNWLTMQEQHFLADQTKERCEFLLST
ncbi:MAG: uridine kinase [Candidatus Planktophila sp.]